MKTIKTAAQINYSKTIVLILNKLMKVNIIKAGKELVV